MSPVDSERLDEGLRRLRELGYLQGPAEAYVARRVSAGSTRARRSLVAGLWVGGGGGLLVGALLTLSAWISQPELFSRTSGAVWLALDIHLVTALLGAALTCVVVFLLLAPGGRTLGPLRRLLERGLLLLPGAIGGLYLADRLGRHVLPQFASEYWWGGAFATALVLALGSSAVSFALASAVALVRLQTQGTWTPPRVGRIARAAPFVVVFAAAIVLLASGPYRSLRTPPSLDDIEVSREPRPPLLIVAVDGASIDNIARPEWSPRRVDSISADLHPASFWNDVATGLSADDHGVMGAAAFGPRGLTAALPERGDDPVLDVLLRQVLPGVGLGTLRPTDARELRRPPVWEIASRAGAVCRVVNWWATYPAARHPRLQVVSDRAFLRLYDGGDVTDSALVAGTTLRGIATDGAEIIDEQLRLARMMDEYHLQRALEVEPGQSVADLRAVLLNGMDILRRGDATESVLAAHERWLADEIGKVLESVASPWMLVVLGPADGDRPLWIAGPLARNFSSARVLAGEWLYSLGIVPSREMPLSDATAAALGDQARPETFGSRPDWSPPAARSGDDLDRLKSLGYIGG